METGIRDGHYEYSSIHQGFIGAGIILRIFNELGKAGSGRPSTSHLMMSCDSVNNR